MKDSKSGKLKYYLYFIANRNDNNMRNEWSNHIIRQRIGVASSDSPNGPWKRFDKPVVTPPNGPLNYYLVNPGVCQLPDGRYLMVLKGRAKGKGIHQFGPMLHGWALADAPEGPFKVQENLLFPGTISAEDPCVWVQDGWIMAAVKDWHGKLGGVAGISYIRGKLNKTDSIDWEIPENASITKREIRWDDGKVTRLNAAERPFILLDKKGQPSHLFIAASTFNPFKNSGQKADRKRPLIPVENLPFNLCLPLHSEKK